MSLKDVQNDVDKWIEQFKTGYFKPLEINAAISEELGELSRELKQMDDTTYYYHANQEKNDFSNWISDIVHDDKLADKIRNAHTPKEALKIISHKLKK